MKVGAVDFLEMPVGRDELLASVKRALDSFEEIARITEFHKLSANRVASLTDRQHQISCLRTIVSDFEVPVGCRF
jgi:two-component system CheB/CheR fusion protein